MHIFSTIVLASVASSAAATALSSGQRLSMRAIEGVFEPRQVTICKPVPAPVTCEKSCGPGNVYCVSYPNCYNPSAGESCCSNGKYCRAGTYCTDGGCCPNGRSLSQCDATVSLSVLPPPAPDATPSPSSSSPPASSPAPTSSSKSTSRSATTSTSAGTIHSSASSAITHTSTTSTKPSVTVSPNTTTTTVPIQVTGAAHKLGSEMGLVVLGGLGLLFLSL